MWKLIRNFTNKTNKYNRIKNSEKAEQSVNFGVHTIIWSIVTILLAFMAALGASGLFEDSNFFISLGAATGFVMTFLYIALLAVGALGAIILIVSNIFNLIYQFRLNKHIIRWFALAFFILSIIAFIVFICLAMF